MSSPYLLVAIAFLAYVLAVDENVAPYLVLQGKRLGLNFRRAFWLARLHPAAPWTRWEINRRAWRTAEELQKLYNLPETEEK
jgi:hypothetical protein